MASSGVDDGSKKGAGEQARLYCPLRAITRSATELRTCVRRDSNPRHCDPEVTALFTAGVEHVETRSGNRRLLRSQPAGHPASRAVLYPLSYRRMGRRTGFEPATSRLADEVTAIFTTDRVEGWRGTIDAVLPLRACGPRTRSVPWHLTEVTDIFTTAMPTFSHRQSKAHAGEQAISVSVTATQGLLSENLCCGAWQPLPGHLHSACVKGGIRTRSFPGAKYPKSSPPAFG
jgi:hypothetical protein